MQHITDATYFYFIQPNKTKYSQAVTFHIYWFITKVLSSAINMIIELTAMLSDNFFFQQICMHISQPQLLLEVKLSYEPVYPSVATVDWLVFYNFLKCREFLTSIGALIFHYWLLTPLKLEAKLYFNLEGIWNYYYKHALTPGSCLDNLSCKCSISYI